MQNEKFSPNFGTGLVCIEFNPLQFVRTIGTSQLSKYPGFCVVPGTDETQPLFSKSSGNVIVVGNTISDIGAMVSLHSNFRLHHHLVDKIYNFTGEFSEIDNIAGDPHILTAELLRLHSIKTGNVAHLVDDLSKIIYSCFYLLTDRRLSIQVHIPESSRLNQIVNKRNPHLSMRDASRCITDILKRYKLKHASGERIRGNVSRNEHPDVNPVNLQFAKQLLHSVYQIAFH